ncbi:PREDICTED: probable peroxygenase 4 [Camelina sativa]|uniref:Probable peroxygenase 4 n=1 Tax=Camelina sativa TaxID=90675 RepID=A0ABM0ST50_CAMSA|nr:PREDICTED: probable peroxygenase 4 [Camelina sativa]
MNTQVSKYKRCLCLPSLYFTLFIYLFSQPVLFSFLSLSSLAMASSNSNEVKFVPEEDNFLQRHVSFFDRNKDGIVYPSETFQGFRAIGCGYALSTFASMFINMGLSRQTRPGKGFSLSFPIEVKNIHLAKHGSDSGVYDKDGRFVASKFEEIFTKHAHTHSDALTKEELKELLNANKEPIDRKGGILAYAEWKGLYDLCKDKNGLLQKETVRAVYDGSLFEKLEKQRANKS